MSGWLKSAAFASSRKNFPEISDAEMSLSLLSMSHDLVVSLDRDYRDVVTLFQIPGRLSWLGIEKSQINKAASYH